LISKQKEIYGLQKGAAQPHVYPKDLHRLEVVFPSSKILQLFEEKISQQFSLVGNLIKTNKSLEQARDLLLPRLMNGEVSI